MKKMLTCLLCLTMLCGAMSIAAAEAYVPAFNGSWHAIGESGLEVYVPNSWKVSTPKDEKDGVLLAVSEDPAITFTLTTTPSEGKTSDELLEVYAADETYKNTERADLEGLPYVLMDMADDSAYIGVVDIDGALLYTFTFEGANTPELQMLVRGVMDSLRESAEPAA